MKVYNDDEVREKLKNMDGWKLQRGMIRKTYTAESFNRGIGFVVQMGILADAADHHPDLKINYNKIEVSLATHSEKGITNKDFNLAKKFDTAFGE